MLLRVPAEVRKRLLVRIERNWPSVSLRQGAPAREVERQHEDVSHLPLRAEPNAGLSPVDLALQSPRRLEPRPRHRRQPRLPRRPHEPLHRLVAAAVLPPPELLKQDLRPSSPPSTPGAAGTRRARSAASPTVPPARTASTPVCRRHRRTVLRSRARARAPGSTIVRRIHQRLTTPYRCGASDSLRSRYLGKRSSGDLPRGSLALNCSRGQAC